jgi:hypothetical protein
MVAYLWRFRLLNNFLDLIKAPEGTRSMTVAIVSLGAQNKIVSEKSLLQKK